ncbi:unnamed protein product [Onchocerca ochengi]|uniref:DUF5641 domain-containing protein n=1 Tax=Onchocerca ochengi TaxID=42157 RepID=A0A182EUW3_ONCOC|nr:unnamed protein product [Onchocerca ochengi]
MWVKNGIVSKRWVALFTCLVTRAVHMEVMKNMSAEAFMQAFRRFVSRRRRPNFVLSDNAKNFVLASKLIQENSNQDERPLKWQFITPGAPWQGGFTKGWDGEQVLCPGDFLWLGYNNEKNSLKYANKSYENDEPNLSIQQNLINRYQNTRRKLQRLWKIWQEEYLEELRKRTQKSHKNPRSLIRRKPIIGEVVLLKGEGPRNSWKMGRVEKLIEGNDGLCRSAVVRISNGTRLTHAIGHLYPLEICSSLSLDSKSSRLPSVAEIAKMKEGKR